MHGVNYEIFESIRVSFHSLSHRYQPSGKSSEQRFCEGSRMRPVLPGDGCRQADPDQSVSLKKLVSLSVKHKANLLPGTDMKILGPVVARQFHLEYSTTESVRTAVRCLKRGGCVIANVGGDREGYTGVFAHEGHFILLIASDGDQICVLDPALRPGRYDEPGRRGKVLLDEPFAWCSPELLTKETDNRSPGFYLFYRKAPLAAGKVL